ncbi:choice-of-anchor I family protein [Demequina soli]|uniref:choice-of-anchor I family protein n=1 Tax=Demequina soli TaxID=1638987 RepID=UPI000AB67526|nr:choice-of-anchor I family protein [Demequina soli]
MSSATRPLARRGLAVGAAVALGAAAASPAYAAIVAGPASLSAPDAAVALTPLGTYETGVFDASAAEIVAFHARSQQLYSVDANVGEVNVIDQSDPSAPTLVGTLAVAGIVDASGAVIPEGSEANSVAVRDDGLVVVAVESATKTDRGWLAFFDTDGDALGAVRVGAQPDMVTVTPDGRMAVTADEGEPNDAYDVDPEGTVSVVTLPKKVAVPTQDAVRIADFHAYEGDALPDGVRVFAGIDGIDHPVSRNLEPEYVAVDAKSRTAYVTLQEADAVAVVDLASATVADVWSLGAKDLSIEGNGIDPSDKDGAIAIQTVPVKALYQPDSIATYTSRGTTYLVTANEGDSRDDWGDYEESVRIKDLGKDGVAPLCHGVLTSAQLGNAALGRLTVSKASGLSADGSCYEDLYAFGGRSFSIWTTDGTQVFDSGDDFERITAETLPAYFNSSNDGTEMDNRSDNKGPEPEGVTIGEIRGRTYAFVGLERIGGVMTYDITSPAAPSFVQYVNNRDFAADPESSAAGDLGPEGLAFIAAKDSPTGEAMVAVGNEVSGTTTTFSVTPTKQH